MALTLEDRVARLEKQVKALFQLTRTKEDLQKPGKIALWRKQTGVFGRCPHDPTCEDKEMCDAEIARRLGL